jgi:all-trans-retinol 13,14-reductase
MGAPVSPLADLARRDVSRARPVPSGVSRYDANVASTAFDVIVIGSGIAGLGIAAILSRAGRKVLVLERHYIVGGMTHTFTRDGFEWDVGLHYLGKVHDPHAPLRQIFDYVTDGALEWAPMAPVYDKLVFGDREYELPAGAGAFVESLAAAFPAERAAITEYVRLVRKVDTVAERYFMQKVLPGPLSVLGWPFARWARRTTLDVLRSLTRNDRLIGVLAGRWGNYGLPPGQSSFGMHALVAAHYLEGGSYPVGGGGAIARHIAPVIARAGGQIRIAADVRRILVRNGRAIGVQMADGAEILARHVISAAGVAYTLRELVPETARPPEVNAGLHSIGSSTGHACLYLGLDGTANELGLEATNLWLHPSYDHDANDARSQTGTDAELPFTYVSSGSARDPDWAARFPTRSTLTAFSPVPYRWFAQWGDTRWQKRGDAYDDLKAQLSARLLDRVCAQLPAVRRRVVHAEISTPLSTRHFTNHPHGAMYGFEHTPARFAQRWLRPDSGIRNLLFVGQDVVSVGVGASLHSAVLTSSVLLRRNVQGFIARESKATRSRAAHR